MGRTALLCLFGLISLSSLLPSTTFGQTLGLSSPSGSPGNRVAIEISIKIPSTKEPPSTLQWDATLPSAQLSFLEGGTIAGPAAQAAGKSVNCVVKAKTGDT